MSFNPISSNPNGDNNYLDYFNFAFIGDEGVGKTSVSERFCNEIFSTEKKKRNPIEIFKKSLLINNVEYSLKFWDIQCDDNLFKLNKSIYERADCIVIVCAINDKTSFNIIDTWVRALSDNIDMTTKQILLLSNKTDLDDERQIGVDELKQKAEELEFLFYETSAKDDIGIKEAFQAVIEKVVNKVYKEDTTELKTDEHNNSSGGSCAG